MEGAIQIADGIDCVYRAYYLDCGGQAVMDESTAALDIEHPAQENRHSRQDAG